MTNTENVEKKIAETVKALETLQLELTKNGVMPEDGSTLVARVAILEQQVEDLTNELRNLRTPKKESKRPKQTILKD